MQETMSKGLQACQSTPLALTTAEESLNSTSLGTNSGVNSPIEDSKPFIPVGSGCNSLSNKRGRMSAKHTVFVLGVDGKPLTPTTNAKARKLMESNQAKPIWNKFGMFGIRMLVETRKETPKSVLGVDFGTKFEGYAIAIGKENNLSVMWKLPDKQRVIRKLKERRQMRRSRRRKKCRRRPARVNKKGKKGFLSPSQLVIVESRMKCIREFFIYYPLDTVAIENVRFNHKVDRNGKNFSTIELGKNRIYNWVRARAYLKKCNIHHTTSLRKRYGYKKSGFKSAETFNAHCSDALAIATNVYAKEHIKEGKFIIVDDTYRPFRRKLHYLQFNNLGVRRKFASGNYKQIRKGIICNFGQVCGGIKESTIRTYDWENKRWRKSVSKVKWLSHKFKTREP